MAHLGFFGCFLGHRGLIDNTWQRIDKYKWICVGYSIF